MFSDQTGKFPITSARGNKYIMVAVELDGNYIDGKPIQSRKAKSLTKAYQAIFQRCKATGVICPNWHILDNEAPKELKHAIRENKCRVELTSADQHRRNAAERATQTFKGHFISVLAGVADGFLINQWDELLPQTILTLNLLRQLNMAPNISAYAYHHGSFDYNWMPIAPMGCAVQVHIKPGRRKTFGEHSEEPNVSQTRCSSSTIISLNLQSHQRMPSSMHTTNCGKPSKGSNTPKMMHILKLWKGSKILCNQQASMQSNRQ